MAATSKPTSDMPKPTAHFDTTIRAHWVRSVGITMSLGEMEDVVNILSKAAESARSYSTMTLSDAEHAIVNDFVGAFVELQD